MRRITICAIIATTALLAAGCAKTLGSQTNEQAQIYYNAWVNVKKAANPEFLWWPMCYGNFTDDGEERDFAYILQDFPGDGEEIIDSAYLFVNYTAYDLDGNVQGSTDMETAHRTGVTYDPSYYYGPVVMINTDYNATVALKDGLNGICNGERRYDKVRLGGRRTMVVPGWLYSSERYSDEADFYVRNMTGSNQIYDITVEDMTTDIYQYQIDSIKSYCARNYRFRDSTYTGFYYKCLEAPRTTVTFSSDTTIYVNYVGRLLNGHVFDTNIADTAKVWNLYSTSTSYGPVEVNWSTDSTAVTMSSSSVITGFASIITRMNDKEKSVGVFYSDLGYGSSGSGSIIPGYAPLEFEITIVDEEE